MISIITITILVTLSPLNADMFNSLVAMEGLINSQEMIIKSIGEYLLNEKKRLIVIEKYLKNMEEEFSEATKDLQHYLGNPIKAFTLIKRQTVDLGYIEKVINKTTEYRRNGTVRYPSFKDFLGAVEGMLRVQVTYKLNITQLANGIIDANSSQNSLNNTEIVTPMTASDCFEIGRSLYLDKDYKRNLIWLREAYHRYMSGDTFSNLTEVHLVDYISHAYYITDDLENTILWTQKLIDLDPNYIEVPYYKKIIAECENRLANKQYDKPETKKNENEKHIKEMLQMLNTKDALCRGEVDIKNGNKNRCYYAVGPHPFLTLAPFKAEELHRDPDIILFHDVINDDEIQRMIDLSAGKLRPAPVGRENRIVRHRVSQIARIDEDADVGYKISKRMFQFTGLKDVRVERLQIANYGIAGHYEPHCDIDLVPELRSHLDRTGTVLIYLSDVEQGGATVFIELGLTIYPKKGAALYWKNKLVTGKVDRRTLHAACPVLRGNKWS